MTDTKQHCADLIAANLTTPLGTPMMDRGDSNWPSKPIAHTTVLKAKADHLQVLSCLPACNEVILLDYKAGENVNHVTVSGAAAAILIDQLKGMNP